MQNITSNMFTGGMDQDILPKFQKEGSYRYALNSVLENNEGELYSISSEHANIQCGNLPVNKQIIGHQLLDDNSLLLFLYDNSVDPTFHEVGIYSPNNCTYYTLAKGFCDFNKNEPIYSRFKIINGCDRIVYFASKTTPFRAINLDNLWWIDNDQNILSCDAVNFDKSFTHIKYTDPIDASLLASASIFENGGSLEYGSYSFWFRLLDPEFNPTNEWVPLTNYIPIGYGPVDSILFGNYTAASNNVSSPYYQGVSSKAITLELQNIESEYYQIAVAKKIADDGTISVDVLPPIKAEFDKFVYTGSNQALNTITLTELLTPNAKIHNAEAFELHNNILLVSGNPKYRDYSTYQRFASKIKTTYKASLPEDGFSGTVNTVLSNHKPTSLVFPTLLHDEIYSLGIVYVHSDGTESPVCHIPGRPADIIPKNGTHYNTYISPSALLAWDTEDQPTSADLFNPDKSLNWQIYSTASIQLDTITSDEREFKGYLGYYETPTTYPEIQTCDGLPYWGEDFDGNAIDETTKIRHHRMPAQWLFPENNSFPIGDLGNYGAHCSWGQYKLSLEFDNIDIPEDVVGWYFVYGDRTNDYTIVDKGFLNILRQPVAYSSEKPFGHDYNTYSDIRWWTNLSWTNPTDLVNFAFINPKTVHEKSVIDGEYISIEKIVLDEYNVDNTSHNVQTTSVPLDIYSLTLTSETKLRPYTRFTFPAKINYKVVEQGLLRKNYLVDSKKLSNITDNNPISYLSSSTEIFENRNGNYNINFLTLDSFIQDFININSPTSSKYSPYFSHQHFVASLKKDRDVFTNLFTIKYKRLSPYIHTQISQKEARGGDTIINWFTTLDTFFPSGSDAVVSNYAGTWIETSLNTEFKKNSSVEQGKYTHFKWTGNATTIGHLALSNYIGSKVHYISESDYILYPENLELDEKYQDFNIDKVYFPIPYNYDFCNDCIEKSPYRIYYSDIDNQETQQDFNRIIKANNYKDVTSTTGPITDIFKSHNQIYFSTSNSIFHLPVNPQRLSSDESQVYIGTGQFLSLPETELNSVDYSLGGLQDKTSRVLTEFGTIYVDYKSRKVFLLNQGLQDISSRGMKSFFQNRGGFELDRQFQLAYNFDFPIRSVISGIGYISTYDPRFKRLIITKKDYKVRSNYRLVGGVSTTKGDVYYTDRFYYCPADGAGVATTLSNSGVFENRSFTISYSFLTNSWVSFHSYIPYYMFNDKDTFFSDNLFKHSDYSSSLRFYNQLFPQIVDLNIPQNSQEIKTTNAVYYNSKSVVFDSLTQQFKPSTQTYNKFIAYNSTQTSGTQILNLQDTLFEDNTALVRVTDRKFRINDIRDYTQDHALPIWDSSWASLESQPYLDKVPTNFNLSKSLFELSRLKDNYLGLRLIYEPINDTVRITTDIINTFTSNKNR